ncbi:hypothetical protein [Mycolicibacterium palauense]|uniref:hypothetical protein n=1 Tax=Mycolicibacterium palauense TaxID=2034511 RepID=UPI000BFEAF43|nr:hypothetical protein [Mycolicibacterium palauense]
MKVYRRGEMIRTDVPWRRDDETGLWWNLGRLPSVRYASGLIAHCRYRGERRADKFSIRVADLAERLAQEPVGRCGPWEELADGTLVTRAVILLPGSDLVGTRGVVQITPPPSMPSFPTMAELGE